MENFSIIILVWNPMKESPIHDHPCNGCWVRVLENEVNEVVYQHSVDGSLEVTSDNIYSEGGVTWMHDIKGYHKISNNGSEIAVTMHIYSPPYKTGNVISLNCDKELCYISYDTEGGVPVTDCIQSEEGLKSITEEVKT